MEENNKKTNVKTPMLFPYEPDQFWEIMRAIIREEIRSTNTAQNNRGLEKVEGLTYKPLLKIGEVCALFQVSRPTIYNWIKHGQLRQYKIRRSVYFLWNDIQQLLPV